MTDKELGTAAGEIFTKAFTLGYETGREYVPVGGMALTAEQVEDVEALVATANPYSAPAVRLRALFPATEPAEERCQSVSIFRERCALVPGHDGRHAANGCAWGYPPAPAEPAEAHCTVPPEGWWCSRAANHDGPCAASEGVAPWVPQPLEADWLDQVDPRDPQSRTHRETAAAKFAEPAEEETKAERDSEGIIRINGGRIVALSRDPRELVQQWFDLAEPGSKWQRDYAAALDLFDREAASSPVVPAPTETGPWQRIEDVPEGVLQIKDRHGRTWLVVGGTWRFEWHDGNWYEPHTNINAQAPFVAAAEEG